MKAKLARVGDSLAVCLPDAMVREFGFEEGQIVELTPRPLGLEVAPDGAERPFPNAIPVYSMKELLADMDRLGPGAVPDSIDWGPDRGSEIIDDEHSPGNVEPLP